MRRPARSTKLARMLNSPDKGVSQTHGITGVPAGLFRSWLEQLQIDHRMWGVLLHQYINNSDFKDASNRYRTSLRGNLTKSLYHPEMTWKTLTKGAQFLQAAELHIKATLKMPDGTVVEATDVVVFDTKRVEIDDEDKPKDMQPNE